MNRLRNTIRVCPRCRTHHQGDKVRCVRCGTPLPFPTDTLRKAYTAETCVIYYAVRGPARFLVSPVFFEYQTPYYSLLSSWDNVKGVSDNITNPVLVLKNAGDISPEYAYDFVYLTDRYVIRLYDFEYTPESQLARDIARYTPELVIQPYEMLASHYSSLEE